MKFMHISDVRLGLHAESGRRWGAERLLEVAGTLKRAAQAAEDDGIDMVLIAGGLFAHRPITTELDEANRIFAAHPQTAFVIVAGESDRLRSNSPAISYRWADNVHYVLSGKPEKITFPGLRTVVFAMSVTECPESAEALIAAGESDRDPETEDMPVRIAVCFEPGLEKAGDFHCSGFSYVALGGRGSHMEVVKDKAFYSGGLEPEGMMDSGEHGYYKGEISAATGTLLSAEFVPLASAAYVPLLVKVNTKNTPEQVSEMIEREMLRRGSSNIYRIRITGKKLPEYSFELADIKSRYRIAELSDEAEPQYDFEALFEEHQQDMIGYFISTLRKNRTDLPEIDKKAMFQGIDALIKTSGKENL